MRKTTDCAGLTFLDPKLIEEPKEDPLTFPLTLNCGKDTWMRVYVASTGAAIYSWELWMISIDPEGFWAYIGQDPLSPAPLSTFGRAVGFIRGHKLYRLYGPTRKPMK